MQYLGGKSRIARDIFKTICKDTNLRDIYIEPFLGAGSVAAYLAPLFDQAILTDASPDLMAMWTAIQDGWVPPTSVSEEEYNAQKDAPVSALRGFVGYGCSFGGKWFAGYARNSRGDNYAKQSSNGIMRKYKAMSWRTPHQDNIWFGCNDYRDLKIPPGSVVYADPPYRNTTKYVRLDDFDSDEFWRTMDKWAEYSRVYVSEYSAPDGWDGWIPIWSGRVQASLGLVDQTARVQERLWTK